MLLSERVRELADLISEVGTEIPDDTPGTYAQGARDASQTIAHRLYSMLNDEGTDDEVQRPQC